MTTKRPKREAAVGAIEPEVMTESDAWVRPLVDGLRSLFRRGELAPQWPRGSQVAIAVAVTSLEPDAEVEPGVDPVPAEGESGDANGPGNYPRVGARFPAKLH